MDYTVTVKGNGEKVGSSSTVVWKIDRTYHGSAVLNERTVGLGPDPDAFMKDPKTNMAVLRSERYVTFMTASKRDDASVHVEIGDRYATGSVVPCGDGTGETEWDLKEWTADATYPGLSGVSLTTDNLSRTYNIFIPVYFFNGDGTKIPMIAQTKYERSGNVKPSKANTDPVTKMVGIPVPPRVQGLFHGALEHPIAIPQPPNFSTVWEYDSLEDLGELRPDEPIFADIPESKTKVRIRIIYRFSKNPLY